MFLGGGGTPLLAREGVPLPPSPPPPPQRAFIRKMKSAGTRRLFVESPSPGGTERGGCGGARKSCFLLKECFCRIVPVALVTGDFFAGRFALAKGKTRGDGEPLCRPPARYERKNAPFPRTDRPYGWKRKAFKAENTPVAGRQGREGRRTAFFYRKIFLVKK